MKREEILNLFDLEHKNILEYVYNDLDTIIDVVSEKVEKKEILKDKNINFSRLKFLEKSFFMFLFSDGITTSIYSTLLKISKYCKFNNIDSLELSLIEYLFISEVENRIEDKEIIDYIRKLSKIVLAIISNELNKKDLNSSIAELLLNIYMIFSHNKVIVMNIRENLDYKITDDILISENLMKDFMKNDKVFYKLNLHIDKILELNSNFIQELKKYQIDKDISIFKSLHKISVQMEVIFDNAFEKNFMSSTVLSINSSLEFLNLLPDIIYNYSFFGESLEDLDKKLKSTLINKLFDLLGWAIYDIKFGHLADEGADLFKIFKNYDLVVNIYLKDIPNKIYIKSLIKNLLDVIEIVSLLKENEIKFKELKEKSEVASRAKSMFLANMSHELRTPLNAIIGFSQILGMKSDTPDSIKNYINKINISGKNLLELVNTILDFSKFEVGKIELHKETVSLQNILNEVLILVENQAKSNNVDIIYPKQLSLKLFLDEKQIKAVFLNLLSNAVKFTKNGKIIIDVKYDINSKNYVFSVCDNGIGIDKKDIPKLFQPFTQVDNPMQKSVKGTGLGLVIIKKIVELHGGTIWVESEKDKGSCFYFTIPVSNKFKVIDKEINNYSDKNVLIIEDNDMFVDIYLECLNKYNFKITNSIKRAKKMVDNNIDLIILDYYLIDGIGIELLFYLDINNLDIPIYIVTAEEELLDSELRGNPMIKDIIFKDDNLCNRLKEI